MATTEFAVHGAEDGSVREPVVNDFSVQVATVNGSGSQSANTVLLRSIFQMGVPVSGKNMFPSNIAGLPTWYTIRASKQGYIARKKEIDFLIAMNPETAKEDVLSMRGIVTTNAIKRLIVGKVNQKKAVLIPSPVLPSCVVMVLMIVYFVPLRIAPVTAPDGSLSRWQPRLGHRTCR